jgi:hypothetical protein
MVVSKKFLVSAVEEAGIRRNSMILLSALNKDKY